MAPLSRYKSIRLVHVSNQFAIGQGFVEVLNRGDTSQVDLVVRGGKVEFVDGELERQRAVEAAAKVVELTLLAVQKPGLCLWKEERGG